MGSGTQPTHTTHTHTHTRPHLTPPPHFLHPHSGRLYIVAGVPSAGPAVAPGAVVVRPTGDVRGNGAFAAASIPAGTCLGAYSGVLLDTEAFDAKYPDGAVRGRRVLGSACVCLGVLVCAAQTPTNPPCQAACGACWHPGRGCG